MASYSSDGPVDYSSRSGRFPSLQDNGDQETPESQPPTGCTCIVSEDAKSCNEHEATCKDWDNTGMDWCYVSSDEESCGRKEKTKGNCGVPWVECSGK